MSEQKILSKIPVDSIRVINNPRGELTSKSIGIKELSESIGVSGVAVPIAVRTNRDENVKEDFDLCVGSRRLFASKLAQKKLIPAIIYPEDTPMGEIAKITHLENHFRENLTIFEEADSVKVVLEAFDGDHEAAGLALNMTPKGIAVRTNIVDNISKSWLKDFKDEEVEPTLPHLEILSKLSFEVQDRINESITGWQFHDFKEFKRICEAEEHVIENAPFDHKFKYEDEHGKMTPCVDCLTHSGSKANLFADDVKTHKALCLNKECWTRKMIVLIKGFIDAHKEHYPEIKIGVNGQATHAETRQLQHTFGGILEPHQYTKKKKSDKNTIPVMILNGKSLGKLIWIAGPKSSTSKKSGDATETDKGSLPKPLKERRALLANKRHTFVNDKLHEFLNENWDIGLIQTKGQIFTIMYLIACVSTSRWGNGTKFNKITKAIGEDGLPLTPEIGTKIKVDVFNLIKEPFLEWMKYNGPITQFPKDGISRMKDISTLFNIDLAGWVGDAKEEYQEPKSWKELNADGTKKAKKK